VQTRRSMTSPSTRADSLLPRKSYDPGHVRSCANRHRDRRRIQMLQGDGLRGGTFRSTAVERTPPDTDRQDRSARWPAPHGGDCDEVRPRLAERMVEHLLSIREAPLEGVEDELPHSIMVVVEEMGP
jgi:hypothetical protein